MYFKNFCINKRKWNQRDLNPLPLSSQTNAQAFNQPRQMIEMCWVDLYVGGHAKVYTALIEWRVQQQGFSRLIKIRQKQNLVKLI